MLNKKYVYKSTALKMTQNDRGLLSIRFSAVFVGVGKTNFAAEIFLWKLIFYNNFSNVYVFVSIKQAEQLK